MATVNTASVVKSVSLAGEYLNHPAVPGISEGYWILAKPNVLTSKTDDAFLVYKWASQQPMTSPLTELPMDGSFEVLEETWDGSTRNYHNSTITHIGPGTNDVTNQAEVDALFFSHLGSLRPAQEDTPFYWDRAYQIDVGGNWFYYQYHQHNPNVYEDDFVNGRMVFSDGKYIAPLDPHYGYMIYTEATVSKVEYQSVLARIHQPSVGGAHSSHLDIELPSTTNANYIIGGIHIGNSNRYHAFYITADGAQWKVLSRTFVLSTRTFTAEANLGTYDLADPVFVSNSNIAEYPFRASCGEMFGDHLYIPVIYNNATSGYDLKIWKIQSADSLSSATLTVSTILTGVSIKPDCHLILHPIENELYAIVGESDGASAYRWTGSAWEDGGQIVSNGSGSNPLRVHGISYNSNERAFYTILSGDDDASGTYSGAGLYYFQLNFTARTYSHFDFDVGNNAFILRSAGSTGYVRYEHPTYTMRRIAAVEPDPIPTANSVFKYDYVSPNFFKKSSTSGVLGEEYFYDVATLDDGRMIFAGRIEENEGNKGLNDFLVAIYYGDEENRPANYYCLGGSGDDYFTGMVQKANANYLYLTGYSKSQLVDLNEQRLHPYIRRTKLENANTVFNDLAIDSSNTIVAVGTVSDDGGIAVTKFDANLSVSWSKIISSANTDQGFAIAVDSEDSIYVGGKTTTNTSSQGGILAKLQSNGDLVYVKTLDAAGSQYIKSMQISSTDNLYVGFANTRNTQIIKMQTDGTTINWQKDIPSFTAQSIKIDTSENVYAAGYNTNQPDVTYTVTNQGLNNYVFNGGGLVDAIDPAITLYRGATYTFTLNATGHPFWIKHTSSTGTGNAYTNGVTNNGVDVGTITFVVPLDAPNTLYYNCQFHAGMAGTFTIADAQDGKIIKMSNNGSFTWARNTAAGFIHDVGVDSGSNVFAVGANTANAMMIKFNSSGTQQWVRGMNIASQFSSVAIDNEDNIYVVGYEKQISRVEHHVVSETRDRAFIARYNQSGAMQWDNYIRSKDPEDNVYGTHYYKCIMDHLDDNVYIVGKTVLPTGNEESGFFTRHWRGGFGTGTAHKDDDVNDYYIYEAYPQANVIPSVSSTTVIETLTNSSLSVATPTHTIADYSALTHEIFDGSSGLWNYVLIKFDLDEAQKHINEDVEIPHRDHLPMYESNAFTRIWQAGVLGDSIADDGNIFGYDILQYSDNVFFSACQVSGSVAKLNTGDSGAYDGLLVRFDETKVPGREFEFYQVGEEFDEEYYSCTKLADANVAMVGRTGGSIGGTREGGYDLIVSILDVTSNTFRNHQTGGPGDDKAVGVHDIGNNQIAIVFQTTDNIANTSTNTAGGDDIGVVVFNYVSNTWNRAFQTGSDASEILDTNGRVSALLPGNVVAIVGATAGVFADDGQVYGASDLFVALCDLNTGNFTKYQTGTTGGDFATCCTLDGDKLLIGGYTDSSWVEPEDGVYIHFDPNRGVKATQNVA